MIEKYYKIDDSANPGYARVEIISSPKQFKGQVYNIRILEIVKPSTFVKCKVGSKKTVNKSLLCDSYE